MNAHLYTFTAKVSAVQGVGGAILESGAHEVHLRGLSVDVQRAFGAHLHGNVKVIIERIDEEPTP